MDIQTEFGKMREKYRLEEDAEDLFVIREYSRIWQKYVCELPEKTVAIFGAGGNAKLTVDLMIKWEEEKKIKYLIDEHSGEGAYMGIPINILENVINDKEVRLVWIASWKYRMEMKEEIRKRNIEVKIVDPYEELKKRGYLCQSEDLCLYTGANKCRWFSKRIIERNIVDSEDYKQKKSQELIAGYFCVFDWVNLKKEILSYAEKGYHDKEKYLMLMSDVDAFLNNVKKQIKEKEQGGVIVFLIDSLSKYVADEMPHLKKWKDDGVSFAEYRNEYPSTREFITSMFTGWRPFIDESYKNRMIRYSDSDFLEYLKKKGIRINFLIDDKKLVGSFRTINSYHTKNAENELLSEVLFEGIMEVINCKEEQITIIYSDTTIHPQHLTPITPYIGYSDTSDSCFMHSYYFDCAKKYTDDLLQYYMSIFDCNKRFTQIVMGDHGINVQTEYCTVINPQPCNNNGAQWDKHIISPELTIKADWIKPGKVDELVSANQFADILFSVVKKEDPRESLKYQKVIPMQFVPGYDEAWINLGIKSRNKYLPCGAAGCMSKEYFFLELEDGEELYYRIEGKEIILLESDDEKQRVRDILGDEIEKNRFPKEILLDPFFERHNKMYYNQLISWDTVGGDNDI